MAVDLVHGGSEPSSGPGVRASSRTVADLDPRFASLSGGAAIVTASIAALVLIGWIVDSDVLKAVIPGLGTMKFNTAICFMTAAVALWLVRGPTASGSGATTAARACTVALTTLAGLTLFEYVTGIDLALDQLFVRDLDTAVNPGRMSAVTAVAFLLLAAALFPLTLSPAIVTLSQTAAAVVVLLGLIGLQGYLYAVSELHSFGRCGARLQQPADRHRKDNRRRLRSCPRCPRRRRPPCRTSWPPAVVPPS